MQFGGDNVCGMRVVLLELDLVVWGEDKQEQYGGDVFICYIIGVFVVLFCVFFGSVYYFFLLVRECFDLLFLLCIVE